MMIPLKKAHKVFVLTCGYVLNYGFGVTKNTVFLRCVLSDIFCFMIAENWNSQFFHPSHLQRHNKSSGCHHKDTNFNHIDRKKRRTCHGKEVHDKMNHICKNRCKSCCPAFACLYRLVDQQ